jgi:hypothetical protein
MSSFFTRGLQRKKNKYEVLVGNAEREKLHEDLAVDEMLMLKK